MKPQQPYRPQHEGYVSEFDTFLDDYLHQHPVVPREQQRGWYLLWDRRVDFGELAREEAATVPRAPGTYDYP